VIVPSFQSRRGRARPAAASVPCSPSICAQFRRSGLGRRWCVECVPRRGRSRLSNRGMDGIVDSIEELRHLVDAEPCISVENERNNDLTGRESPAFEGSVARVGEDITAVGTPDPGTGPRTGWWFRHTRDKGPAPTLVYSAARFQYRAALGATLLTQAQQYPVASRRRLTVCT
jgi:hypothetical protein